MRILIVGGGIAGLTLAAKLRQQGREPVVVEQSPEYSDIGYVRVRAFEDIELGTRSAH